MVNRNSAPQDPSQAPQLDGRSAFVFPASATAIPLGTNPVLDPDPAQTLENAVALLAFVADWNTRAPSCEFDDWPSAGLSLVIEVLDDAMRHALATIRHNKTGAP